MFSNNRSEYAIHEVRLIDKKKEQNTSYRFGTGNPKITRQRKYLCTKARTSDQKGN